MAGPAIPEISFTALADSLQIEGRRIPIEGTIEPTFRCNLNCAHCYVNEPAASPDARRGELSLAEWQAIIDQICDAGCLALLITGGEPLLRPDFPDLYVYAIRKGLLVTLFTNGTLISDRIADLFADFRPERIEITLYGITRETYERIAQVPGSFEQCLAGIRRVAERKLPLKLKTMAMAWNRHEIGAMREFAAQLGAKFIYDGQLNPRVDGRENPRQLLQLSGQEVVGLDAQEPELSSELREFCRQFVRPGDGSADQHLYTCGAGQNSFTIDPYGRLQLCVLARSESFDLRTGTFAQGWTEFFPRLRARRWQSASPCRTCSLISLCGSCPAAAQLEYGNPEAPIPRFCEIAHLRAHAALGPACGHRPDASCCLARKAD
jgi:radical SAM protein with 4Fe4S-binding SPASM domain